MISTTAMANPLVKNLLPGDNEISKPNSQSPMRRHHKIKKHIRMVPLLSLHTRALFLFAPSLVMQDTNASDLQNPFTNGGCLYERMSNWTKKRVCSSDDPPDYEQLGYCEKNIFDYPEIRIASQNWESAIFETWYVFGV
jgi:hypothetical protein